MPRDAGPSPPGSAHRCHQACCGMRLPGHLCSGSWRKHTGRDVAAWTPECPLIQGHSREPSPPPRVWGQAVPGAHPVCPVTCPRSSHQWPSLHSGQGVSLHGVGVLSCPGMDCGWEAWLAESPAAWGPPSRVLVGYQAFLAEGPGVFHSDGVLGNMLGKPEKHQLRGQGWRLWASQAWQAAGPHTHCL